MPLPLPRAYLCRRFTPTIEAALHERFDLAINEGDSILPPDAMARAARDAEVLLLTATETLRAETLAQLPALRVAATSAPAFPAAGFTFICWPPAQGTC